MPRDAFLFYVDDWLSSGRIELMDAHEERGYLRLLLRAWKDPDCSLPAEDVTLASWSKMGMQWFRETADKTLRMPGMSSGAKVRACFREANGRLINDRQRKEWDYQRAVNEKRAASGKKGGRPRKVLVEDPPLETPPSENKADTPEEEKQTVIDCLPDGLANGKQNETNRNQKLKPSANAEEKKASPKKTGEANGRGCRFSESELPAEWLEFAVKKFGWTAQFAHDTFDEFADYWRGAPGPTAMKLDWIGTWRNRCREIAKRLPTQSAGRQVAMFPRKLSIAEEMSIVSRERLSKGQRV